MCARLSIDAHSDPPTHDAYCRLISDYEKLIPHIAPKHSSYILWHPDLHASNILITDTPPSCKLTGIIDWQGATVAPYYLQLDIPPAYTAEEHTLVNSSHEDGPELSSDVNDLDDEQQRRAHLAHRHALRQRLHEIFMHDQDPELAEEFFLTCRAVWSAAVGVDEDRAPLVPFPIEINDADERQIKEEWSTIRRDASMCDELLQRLGIPLDGEGIVDAGQYEAAKHAVEDAKEAAINDAPSQCEKERIANVWPLQDGKVSLTAESCY
ncbi:hypothetical protein EWM64_g10035 [Hericium alpestre]|uniref:Altered inheritance of mitochondria protein 9, mitochondrial n=1 Tax=Hericium alpestre TaxID=135208 RepID=A0A4Y9ZIW0_9AGAM|nr:hypothetical protein EWM64_g10035 [Hericium alpestre]